MLAASSYLLCMSSVVSATFDIQPPFVRSFIRLDLDITEQSLIFFPDLQLGNNRDSVGNGLIMKTKFTSEGTGFTKRITKNKRRKREKLCLLAFNNTLSATC